MKRYKSLYHESNNDYDSSLSKLIFKNIGLPKVTLTILYKIKSIKNLKDYFKDYSLAETVMMVNHQKNNIKMLCKECHKKIHQNNYSWCKSK